MPDKRQPRTIHTILNEMIERVNNDTQRLRILEQTTESLTSRMNMLEQATLQARRDLQKALGDINMGLESLADRMARNESVTKEIISHMKKLVTENKVKELESLIEIYNPVKSSFVTKEEMQRAFRESQDKTGKK
jgi:hypothetical protein